MVHANFKINNNPPLMMFFVKSLMLLIGFGVVLTSYKYFMTSDYLPKSLLNKFMLKQSLDNIDSVTQEDPKLISYIKDNLMVRPNGKPYNLSRPQNTDFTEFNQWKLLEEVYESKKNGTFIEVGAYDGELLSNTLNLELKYGWTGLLIEPNPITFKKLITKNRKVNAIECCLSDSQSPKLVNFKISKLVSQILNKKSEYEETVDVWCYPLYALMVSVNLRTIDLLSIDLEGYEIKVLQTLPWDKVDIKTILIEFFHVPEGKNAVKKFFEEKNYKLVKEFPLDFFFTKK